MNPREQFEKEAGLTTDWVEIKNKKS